MADYALKLTPRGKWSFDLQNGDLVKTDTWNPAILRLLVQGAPWIGDDGERTGDSLQDVQFIDSRTKTRVNEIVEQRLGVLVRLGVLTAAELVEYIPDPENGRFWALVSVTRVGAQPVTLQVPLTL